MSRDIAISGAEALADWIETSVLVSASGRLGLDRLFALAAEELQLSQLQVSSALRLIVQRRGVLGELYPFEASPIAVRRVESALADDYATLLFLTPVSTARQLVRSLETSEMGELFERLAVVALTNFWGTGGRAVRFGYPSELGRPKEFDQAIEWLAKLIGLRAGRGYRPPLRKDGGVDIIAWRQFSDGRQGFPIALAQCTVQQELYTKTSDVDLRLWASWLAMDTDPLNLLVIPGTVRRQGPEWGQLSTVVTVIERLRLIELLGRGGPSLVKNNWTVATLNALRPLLGAHNF